MSNAGQAVLSIGGAVVGWFVSGGNPVGAIYGFQAGYLAGSLMFPTELAPSHGPRIQDLNTTTAALGIAIPYIYGTIAVPGFVIYLGCPEEVSHTEEIGGKGGGGGEQEQTTYTYFQTLGVGLCEGAIDGLLRVWENGELVYDVREQQEGETDDDYATRIEVSSEYAATFSLYLGDEDQEADPTLEAELGVGNVPAMRGLAYIVFPNRQLSSDQGLRHPQFRFEVYKAVSVGRQIIEPTNLSPANRIDTSGFLAVNWAQNRFLTWDRVNGYFRLYRILDNTEILQPVESTIIPASILDLGLTGSPWGDFYIAYFTGANEVTISQHDGDTLELLSSMTASGASAANAIAWERALAIQQYGVQEVRKYLIGSTLVTDNLWIANADPLGVVLTGNVGSLANLMICKGRRSGADSFAWVITWTAAASGVGDDLEVYKIKLSEQLIPILLEYQATQEVTHVANIAPSDIDPTWTRFFDVKGMAFDETDDTIIFQVRGHDATAGVDGDPVFVKYDPDAEEIVWITDPDTFPPDAFSTDTNWNQTRLRGDHLYVPQFPSAFTRIDTRTGEVTEEDWSSEFSAIGVNPAFGNVYDSGQDAMVSGSSNVNYGPLVIFFDRRIPGRVSLAEIVADVWDRVGGDAADIDVADLEERYVLGYATTSATGRGAIEPLRPLGPFDGVESEGILKFPTRGKAIVHSFDQNELGVFEGDAPRMPAITVVERQDVELPRRMRVKYIAPSRDYENGEQLSPTRFTSATVNDIDVDIPVALEDDQAAQTAEILWSEAWISRWKYETTTDVEFLALDPADAVEVPFDGRLRRARILSIDDAAGGLIRKLALVRDDDGTYTSSAVADTPLRSTTAIASYSLTGLILLDLPPLREEDDDPGIYAALYPIQERQWNGAQVQRSTDGGGAYSVIGSGVNAATVGNLTADLPSGVTTVFDEENTIEVDLDYGEFASRTEDELLELRANALAIGAHGRWEIVQFRDATQTGETTWSLSGLLRGRRGTEFAVGTGVTGDRVVLLEVGVIRLPLAVGDIDLERVYRAVSFGMAFSTASPQTFTGEGEALRPFSPVNIHGERDGSNNLEITWTRRDRIGQELESGSEIAMSEAVESYEIDIVDTLGSPQVVLRTLTSSTAEVTYTAAQQITDGLTPGEPVNVLVYQISATVDRGHAGEATV